MENKEIEEMASDMDYACTKRDLYPSDAKEIAKALYSLNYRKISKDSVVLSKEWWDKSRTQKTFKFYKDENLSKELYLIPYSVCIRPSEDNMSLLSLYKTLVWCGYASENYWDWCENTKKAKEVSFYEYIDELIKAIQEQARKETAEKIIDLINWELPDIFNFQQKKILVDKIRENFGVGIKE